MLHEFLMVNRSALIERCRVKVGRRSSPPVTSTEIEEGVPLFLDQLIVALRHEAANPALLRDGKVDFSSLFLVLDHTKGQPISLADAKAKGIPVIAYGSFLNDVVNFIIIALVIFIIVKIVNKLRKKDPGKKDCPRCLTAIPIAATRCAACCADLNAA